MNCVATVRHIARESVETTPRTCCARVRRVIPFVYQPETTAYLETVGIVNDGTIYFSSTIYEITGSAIWTAVDNCVIAIKTALGLALGSVTLPNRMKFWYPRIGGTATRHKYNAVDPTTFVGTYNGGFTHDGSGDTPNGTNAYFATGCQYKATNFVKDSQSMFVWSKTDINEFAADYGAAAASNAWAISRIRNSGNYQSFFGENGISSTTANPDSLGFFGLVRTSLTSYKQFKNGAVHATKTTTATDFEPVNDVNIHEYAMLYGGSVTNYTTRKHTHFMALDGVTDTEALDLYNAIANFETALNR